MKGENASEAKKERPSAEQERRLLDLAEKMLSAASDFMDIMEKRPLTFVGDWEKSRKLCRDMQKMGSRMEHHRERISSADFDASEIEAMLITLQKLDTKRCKLLERAQVLEKELRPVPAFFENSVLRLVAILLLAATVANWTVGEQQITVIVLGVMLALALFLFEHTLWLSRKIVVFGSALPTLLGLLGWLAGLALLWAVVSP